MVKREMYGQGQQGCEAGDTTPSAVNLTATSLTNLPTRWDDKNKNELLTISEDGRRLAFNEPWRPGDKEAAAARANYPVPSTCGIYYYETSIIDKGRKGHISVGFIGPHVSLSRLPGWDKDSWGYHGDDGNAFASGRDGIPFGPQFTTGDVIGCGINVTNGKIFYTRNGSLLGCAFDAVEDLKGKELYPAVGLRSENEAISANLGQEPFKFDVEGYSRTFEAEHAGKPSRSDD